jgi:hypothetical protein
MSDLVDSRACPQCGSSQYSGGITTAVRTCRECGTRYRPAESGMGRGLVAAVIIVPSLLGLAVAGVGLALALDPPPNDGGAVAAGLACFAVFGLGSAIGLILGVRELRQQPATHEPSLEAEPGALVPPERAAEIVRACARLHGARHIVKQLDGIRPGRIARARARFARQMNDGEFPLILVDESFFRTGAVGFLLTNRALYTSRLPGPIALEDIRTVRHRPPETAVTLVEGGLVLLHIVFPPAILLALPLALRRARQRKNALLVNDRVVYAGDKNLAWNFWLDVLPALAAELAGPRVELLEAFPADGEPLRTTDPDWESVEQVIRSLNADSLPVLRLWAPGRAIGLEIAGGDGRYTVRPLRVGPVEVQVGEVTPASSVQRVVRIARQFAETGSVQ